MLRQPYQMEHAKAALKAALIGLYAAHAQNGDDFDAMAATIEFDASTFIDDVPHFTASYFVEKGERAIAGGSL